MSEKRDIEPSIAVFCDFENVAIGAREARFDDFQIGLVLERLLDKGKIVIKKAYADWERYKAARRGLHGTAFELIEIPHVSYSGKNSADIRLVVDALDLCYTKSHVEIFAIISGDSDFSPLVSKLRENDKRVIGIGVKSSSSDLLIDNCDEFIFYDDLVRERKTATRPTKAHGPGHGQPQGNAHSQGGGQSQGGQSQGLTQGHTYAQGQGQLPGQGLLQGQSAVHGTSAATPAANQPAGAQPQPANSQSSPQNPNPSQWAAEPTERRPLVPKPAKDPIKDEAELEKRRMEALEHVLDTVEGLFKDRDDALHGSLIKQTLKRKRPSFSESYHGYRSFSELLEDAAKRGMLELQKDERAGGYVVTGFGPSA